MNEFILLNIIYLIFIGYLMIRIYLAVTKEKKGENKDVSP